MANNITVLDSTGTSKNWATSEGSDSQHRQHVVPTDANGTAVIGTTADAAKTTDTTGTVIGFLRGIVAWFARLGSLDGAAFTAGSSYVWPGLAGVYQSTVGTLTAGQRGLARLTSRRAVVTAGDYAYAGIFGYSVGGAGDLTVSTTSIVSGFGSPTVDHLLSATWANLYIRVPMGANYKQASIAISSSFDVSTSVTIYELPLSGGAPPGAFSVATGTIAAGQAAIYYPTTNPISEYVIYLAATSPTTGYLSVVVNRRA